MNLKHIFGLLVCIVTSFQSAIGQNQNTNISEPQAAAVDAIFAAYNQPETPGASLGIIKNGKLTYAKGYGFANLEYDIPNSPTSVFRIGSTSKQFTAACIMLLVQQGKLSLDDTLDRFFPDFPSYAKTITVRHLVHHTSGIRDYLQLAYLSGLGDDDFYTDETLMKWLINQEELNFNPGEEFTYSNSGYWLLGQIVGKVSGMPMATFAHDNIFAPLGMKDTHFHSDHTAIVKNRASGYAPKSEGGFRISMTILDMIGDGGVFSTVEDLKKWDDAFYASNVLNQDFWQLMTTQGTLNNGESIPYAAGLFIGEHQGLKTIDHGGAFVGFRAEMIRFPEQRFSVIILANRADANPTRMGYAVADVFLKNDYKKSSPDQQEIAVKMPETITLPTAQLKAFEGSYWNNKDHISRSLVVVNDTLTYDRGNGRTTKMAPISPTAFLWLGPNIPVTLQLNAQKNPTSFQLTIPGQGISEYQKYEPISQLTEQQILTYEGNYYSKELDATYSIVREKDNLILKIQGKPEGPITPVKEDVFSAAGWLLIEFTPDKKEFTVAAGRVQNLRFVKQ